MIPPQESIPPIIASPSNQVKSQTRFPWALRGAGWDEVTQIREEVSFTKGRIIVRGKLVSRGKGKRADYILSVKPNIPIALIEAKENPRQTA